MTALQAYDRPTLKQDLGTPFSCSLHRQQHLAKTCSCRRNTEVWEHPDGYRMHSAVLNASVPGAHLGALQEGDQEVRQPEAALAGGLVGDVQRQQRVRAAVPAVRAAGPGRRAPAPPCTGTPRRGCPGASAAANTARGLLSRLQWSCKTAACCR